MPFNSHEVFRYVNTYNDLADRPFKQQKLSKFIHHKDFDVNVKKLDRKRYDNIDYKLKIKIKMRSWH